MKIVATLFALTLSAAANVAFALDIQPYTPDRFAAHQKAGEAVVLHFHADWCPVCRAQSKVLNGWQGDAAVPGTVLVVNYDKERDLKRQLGVRTQSTLIAYKGTAEKARLAGETDASALRTLLDSVK